jgi:hypothetical protein
VVILLLDKLSGAGQVVCESNPKGIKTTKKRTNNDLSVIKVIDNMQI